MVVAAFIAMALAVDIALRVAYAGSILPGTQVAGVEVGGTSRTGARDALATAFSGERTVTLVHGGRRFRVRAGDIGFRLDAAASAASAYRARRENGPGGAWAAMSALWGVTDVDPVIDVKRSQLRAVVGAIARRIDRRPFAGGLRVEGRSSAKISPVAPRAGRSVDQRAAMAAITAALTRRATGVLRLPVRVRPTVDRSQVEAVARTARAYVRTPLVLRGLNTTVTLRRGQVAAVLDVEHGRASGAPRVRLGVDRSRLKRLMATLAGELDREPVDARLRAPTRPVTVDAKGDLAWRPRRATVRVAPARSGRRVGRTATAAAVATAVDRRRHTARLAVVRVPASVTTNAAREVKLILGTFTSRFACCQPRAANIQLIAKAVDNTVIPPGRQFSLNDVAGPRTASKGFKKAPFIADGKLVPSVGGGVSQFSTTMYNAAYFAGLRLDRHQPHSFYIDRYPPGREATLNYPDVDLAWTNDTNAPVLVRASADSTSVTVTLYGGSRVRRVDARSGPRVPRGGGFAITVTRTVAYRAGRKLRQSFTTTYDPPPAAP